MKNRTKLIEKLILLITITVACIVVLNPIFKSLNFGLDLQGGFEVLYEVEPLNEDKLDSGMLNSTYKSMLKRIDGLGVSEPVITVEGDNKIRVQLAGVTNIEDARRQLSKVASLTFRDTSDNLLMQSSVISKASVGVDSYGRPAVSLHVKDKDKFFEVTKKISSQQENMIVIWLDFDEKNDSYYKTGIDGTKVATKCGASESHCLSAATVSEGFASDVIIQGNFTQKEVEELVTLINSGSLPTKLTEISSKTVDATFGKNSLKTTYIAGIIGIILIMLYMILTYHFAGFVASVSILVYTIATFFTFWLVGGVLTLSGIAAVVIGIGMSVDASVITFSRIKDELKKGTGFKSAVKYGNKEALGTIIDSNLTTLLVAIILFVLGESSVRGFATMLIISILATILVMVFVNRYLINMFVETSYFDKKQNLFIGFNSKKVKNKNFDFIKNSKKVLASVLVLLVLGFALVFTRGLNLGIDFKSGSSITVKTDKEINMKEELNTLGYNVYSEEKVNGSYIVKIDEALSQDEVLSTKNHFEEKYEATTDIGVVSNMVKKELIKNAIISLIVASIGMIIYISIRYRFSYAISGLIALLHDVSMIIIVFSLLKLEVSSIFIAAILSIVGYSINDTIVIFDRIREELSGKKLKTQDDLKEAVNNSLNNTLSRSIITTITTLLPVVSLILLGSREILNFNIALLIGLVVGSFSSVFIASQLWYLIEKKNVGKPARKKWYEE